MLRALYVDFNSYFASVEQQLRPELRGRPVAVVPMLADTTCAIAASMEAKRLGIRTGTRVADARRLCPDLALVVSRPRVYVEFHRRAREIVETCAPVAGVTSIDEMWLRLGGRDRAPEAARRLALEIKHRLRAGLGDCVTCSIGIAPNPFLAKTASDLQKPNGLVVIDAADLPRVLPQIPLRDLCGIGPRMAGRLADHGIGSTAALWTASPDRLRDIWGGIEGERFWRKLHGEDIEPGDSETASISHSQVLAPERRSHEHAAAVLSRLTQKAAMRLRDGGLLAGRVSVYVKTLGGPRFKAQERIEPTDRTALLLAGVERLLASLSRDRIFRTAPPLAVGVALTHLSAAGGTSQALFDDDRGGEALDRTVDRLNLKYGARSVFWGSAFAARHDARVAIAFNHIPDLRGEADAPPRTPAKPRLPNARRAV